MKSINELFKYDEVSDVLYIKFNNEPGIAKEISNNFFVRINPYTDKVVGITIMDFKETYFKNKV